MSFTPEVFDEAAAVLRSLVGPVRAEPGCIATQLLNDAEETCQLTWVEEWRDIKEFEQHLRGAEFRQILAVIELAASQPQIEIDDVAARRGFDLVAEILGRATETVSKDGGDGNGRA